MVDTTIEEFVRSAGRWGESTRIRLTGTVTCSLEDHTYFIQDRDAGVYVFQKPPEAYQVGDRVEVTGFASLGGFSATMHRCTSRWMGRDGSVVPARVTATQALQGTYDMRLIQIQGRLTAERPHGREQWVVRGIEGTASFVVALPDPMRASPNAGPPEGTLLELTGVCGVRAGEGRVPSHFVLFLRTAADVRVIGGPPWWSLSRALTTLGVALAGLALAAGWLALLRRQVLRQTRDLRESFARQAAMEQRFQAIFEASPDPILIARSSDERILLVNPAFERLFGYRATELLGRTSQEAGLWADPDLRASSIARLRSGGSVSNLQGQALSRDGRVLTLLGSAELVEFNGEPCFLTMVRDISQREAAERELRESEERFRQLAASIQEVFWLLDPRTPRLLYVSPAFGRIRGGPPPAGDASSAHLWAEALHPDDRSRILDQALARMGEGRYDEEFRIVRSDGSVRWIHDRAFPVRDPSGALSRVAGVSEDITARKQIEERLRQSQKLEAIGRLAGGVAHDFNNILASILGNVELAVLDAEDGEAPARSLDEIRTAALRARALVQQILAFSQQQPQARSVIAPGPVVSEAVRLLRASIPAGVRIELSVASDTPSVLADPTQLHQVVMNLATNAWHALPDNTGVIRVQVRACDVDETSPLLPLGLRPGRHACLTVQDNGSGMDPATLERMYEPFFTTKDPGRGSGLGLSVVHGIVSAHEGAIEVESERGRGTTFRVFLPAVAPVSEPVEPPGGALLQRGSGQQVLFLDDEEPLVFLARRLLGRLGYRVEGFTRPEEALAAYRGDPGRFELVVTDLNMPGWSGLQIADEVLRIRPDAIVVLSSGHVTEDLRRTALQRGIREVIYKPRSVADLSETLYRLVNP